MALPLWWEAFLSFSGAARSIHAVSSIDWPQHQALRTVGSILVTVDEAKLNEDSFPQWKTTKGTRIILTVHFIMHGFDLRWVNDFSLGQDGQVVAARRPTRVREICRPCRTHNMDVHIDGAMTHACRQRARIWVCRDALKAGIL